MALTLDYVARRMRTFLPEKSVFFDSVADDVHCTVMGTHPVAGVYNSKADFLKHTFERLQASKGRIGRNEGGSHTGDTAIVEMASTSIALNGQPYAQRYC